MNTYNPMLDYQRNNLLAQQQMIQNQLNQLNAQRQTFNPYPQNQANDPFFIRQVGSIEEVKGYPVEPQTIYLFPDTGTGDIYLKRLNTDNGKSEIITYKAQVKESPVEKVNDKSDLDIKLDSIEKKIGDVYESISSLKIHAEPSWYNATTDASENESTKSTKVQSSDEDVRWKDRSSAERNVSKSSKRERD